MDLSKEEVFTLINAYRSQRVLWDSNQKGYFNKYIKIKAWKAVAATVGVDLENARRKMASLLGSFRRERSKGKKISTNDPSGTTEYKSDWFAFKALSFLLDPELNTAKLDSRRPQGDLGDISNNFENENENEENEAPVQYEHDYVTPDTIVSDTSQEITNVDMPKPITLIRKRSLSSLHAENTEYPAKRISREPDTQNESVRKDATAKFVKYLEAKLNLFNPTASAILIHKINQLIFEAEMSSISQPHSFSMASASPKSSWAPSPPPLVQIEVSSYDNQDDEDRKDGIGIDT